MCNLQGFWPGSQWIPVKNTFPPPPCLLAPPPPSQFDSVLLMPQNDTALEAAINTGHIYKTCKTCSSCEWAMMPSLMSSSTPGGME